MKALVQRSYSSFYNSINIGHMTWLCATSFHRHLKQPKKNSMATPNDEPDKPKIDNTQVGEKEEKMYLLQANILTSGPQDKDALEAAPRHACGPDVKLEFAPGPLLYLCDFGACGRTFETYDGLQPMECLQCKCKFDICNACLPSAASLNQAALHDAHRK